METKIIIGKEEDGVSTWGDGFVFACKPFAYKDKKIFGLWIKGGSENLNSFIFDIDSVLGSINSEILEVIIENENIKNVTGWKDRLNRLLSVLNINGSIGFRPRKFKDIFSFKATNINKGKDKDDNDIFIIDIDKKKLVADALSPEFSQIKMEVNPDSEKIFKDWQKNKETEIRIKIDNVCCYDTGEIREGGGMDIKVWREVGEETTNSSSSAEKEEPDPFAEAFKEDLTFTIDDIPYYGSWVTILNVAEGGVTVRGTRFTQIEISSAHPLLKAGNRITIQNVLFGPKGSEIKGEKLIIKEAFFTAIRKAEKTTSTKPPNHQTNNNTANPKNNEEVKQEIEEEVAQEEENTKNNLDDDISRAQNGSPAEKVTAIKNSGAVFGKENFQQEEARLKVIENELFQEDPEKYRQAIVSKVEANLAANNLTEGEITDQQWKEVKEGNISAQNQIEEIARQVNIQIVQKGAEKVIVGFENQIQQYFSTNQKEQISTLYSEIVKFTERIKDNIYTKEQLNRAQALLQKIENHNPTTSPAANTPNQFPWLPVSLGVVGLGLFLIVALVLVKNRKSKKQVLKRNG